MNKEQASVADATIESDFARSTSFGWKVSARVVCIALTALLVGAFSDLWLQSHGGSLPLALIDDSLVAIGAGLLVLVYERRQSQSTKRQLEMARLMNHHVRNSLQAILYADFITDREKSSQEVRNAVGRIEWALRECSSVPQD